MLNRLATQVNTDIPYLDTFDLNQIRFFDSYALKMQVNSPIMGLLDKFVFPLSGVFWLRRGLQSYLAHAEGATFLVNPVAKL